MNENPSDTKSTNGASSVDDERLQTENVADDVLYRRGRRPFDLVTHLLLLISQLTTPPKMQVMMCILMNLKIFLRSHLSLNDVDLPGNDFNPVNGGNPQPTLLSQQGRTSIL